MTRRTVPLLALLALVAGCGEPAPRPSFVLIVAEELRADAPGCGGSPDARTPVLDALARSGLQFRTCMSQSPRDLPALATLLTGRFPSGHGANRPEREVAPGVPMLAENLRTSSYRTGAFLAGNLPDGDHGLARGFDEYADRFARTAGAAPFELVDAALAWVHSDWRPCFLLVRPAGGAEAMDEAVKSLLRGLEEDDPARPAFLLFTASHGPAPNGSAAAAAGPLHRDRLEVPLFLSAPDRIAPALRDDAAMLIDVFPTVLQCLGLAPTRIPGRGLIRAARGEEDPDERPLYAEVADGALAKAVRLEDWKAIHDERADTWTLHDLAADPGETRDVAEEHPDQLKRLRQAMPEPGAFDVAVRTSTD